LTNVLQKGKIVKDVTEDKSMTRESFEPGIYQISNERYHASEGLSRSRLWTFKQLPYKYWYEYLSGEYERPKESKAFFMGSMVHTMVLEPDMFSEEYHVMPKANRTTKQGKIDYALELEKAEGKILVNSEDLEIAESMRKAICANQTAMDIMYKAKIEQSIFWRDEQTGLMCKARPDAWNHPIMSDLKTTEDAGYRGFQMSAFKDGYFLQAAMMYEASKSLGQPFEKFVFMCVEKKAPYSVGLYMLDDEALQFGLDLFHKLLADFAECLETNVWPDYGIQMLMIPKYATMELTNE